MTRSTAEWVGATPDTAIPPRVKDRVVARQGHKCASCARPFGPGKDRPEFDHHDALINGGENREANLRALCGNCHGEKTKRDVAMKAKDARVRKKHLGLSGPKRKMAYRKFDGTPVWPGRDT